MTKEEFDDAKEAAEKKGLTGDTVITEKKAKKLLKIVFKEGNIPKSQRKALVEQAVRECKSRLN